jgi:hypothetical protein
VVPADGGAAPAHFGKFDNGGLISWPMASVLGTNRAADWERNPNESEVYSVAKARPAR